MSTQRYSVTPHPIETILTWVKSVEIAISEIQRPFVWEATKVRNLRDSLYEGYPVGYLIAWRNHSVKLKDGTNLAGNLTMSCIPTAMLDRKIKDVSEFLEERRKLMALKIKTWFEVL